MTWRQKLELFLHPLDGKGPAHDWPSSCGRPTARRRTTTRPDCAAAAARSSICARSWGGGDGFIVLFRLSCLDVISQRFGPEAVEDCLMAVSAFLTAGLHSDDSIYHWSDSALLAILQGRSSEYMVSAELDRIIAQNRESSINVAGASDHAAHSDHI